VATGVVLHPPGPGHAVLGAPAVPSLGRTTRGIVLSSIESTTEGRVGPGDIGTKVRGVLGRHGDGHRPGREAAEVLDRHQGRGGTACPVAVELVGSVVDLVDVGHGQRPVGPELRRRADEGRSGRADRGLFQPVLHERGREIDHESRGETEPGGRQPDQIAGEDAGDEHPAIRQEGDRVPEVLGQARPGAAMASESLSPGLAHGPTDAAQPQGASLPQPLLPGQPAGRPAHHHREPGAVRAPPGSRQRLVRSGREEPPRRGPRLDQPQRGPASAAMIDGDRGPARGRGHGLDPVEEHAVHGHRAQGAAREVVDDDHLVGGHGRSEQQQRQPRG